LKKKKKGEAEEKILVDYKKNNISIGMSKNGIMTKFLSLIFIHMLV
jgi:hypothetical protein